MANKYDTMVSSIVDLVGGKENIRSLHTALHGCASM